MASLAGEVLMGATGAPRPSPALRSFLGEPVAGSAAAPEPTRPVAAVPAWRLDTVAAGPATSDRRTNVVPFFRRLRLTVGIAAAAATAAAAAAVAVGGTTSVLPEPVMQAVSWVVEAVTPFELHDPARTVTGGDDVPDRGGPRPCPPAPSAPVPVPARPDRAWHPASRPPPHRWPDRAHPASLVPTDR